jgi:hypothetical protein
MHASARATNFPTAVGSQSDKPPLRALGFCQGPGWFFPHRRFPGLCYLYGLAVAILTTLAAAAQSGPVSPPAPDSEALFVGYFHYHSALATEVERRRKTGDETGEILLENVCGTIGIQKTSFWSLTPVIRDALAKLATGNAAGVEAGAQPRQVQLPARTPSSLSDVVGATIREIQSRLSPDEWDHLRSYLNDSFRMRIHSQVVRSK